MAPSNLPPEGLNGRISEVHKSDGGAVHASHGMTKREDDINKTTMPKSGNGIIPNAGIDRSPHSAAIAGLVDEDGFERVMTAAERKALRKKAAALAQADHASQQNVAKPNKDNCESILNKFRTKLKNYGIDCTVIPITSDVAITCEASIEELNDLIEALDAAIKSASEGVTKPIQFTTLEEVDKRIRDTTENLKRLKTQRGKGSGPKPGEVETVARESEVYIAYLRDQRVVVEAFQRMKTFKTKLYQYKKAVLDAIALRSAAAKRANAIMEQAAMTPESKTVRQQEYICGILRNLKGDKGAPLDPSAVIKTEVVLMATANRFQPPYNYLKRIKERFCVHIDPVDSFSQEVAALRICVHGESGDVEECIKFLKDLDFHWTKKVNVDFERLKKVFGGISGLSKIEESFNVLTFYYQGVLDLIGSRDGVNLAANYMEEKIATFDNDASGKKVESTSVSSAPATLAEHEARRIQIRHDFLICKALSTRFRPWVRAIEADLGVIVSFDFSPKDGKGALNINVDSNYKSADKSAADSIKAAVTQVEDLIASMGSLEVPGSSDEETLAFLFSEDTLRCRFVSQDFGLLRYNGLAHVVGKKGILKDALVRVTTLLRFRHHKPKELFVPMVNALLLSSSTLAAVEDWTGVTVMTRESINGSVLVIYGGTEQQDECVKQVNDILSTHVEYPFDLSPAHMAVLSDNKYRIIRDLEQKTQVHVVMKKDNNRLVFHGQKEKVDEAVDVLKAFTNNFICLDHTKVSEVTLSGEFYAWLRVPKRHIGAVIGKGGSTLREIIDSSGLRNMFVSRGDSSDDIVCFEGDKGAVQRALEVLSHILEFDGVNQQDSPVEDVFVGKYSSSHSVLRHNAAPISRRQTSVRSNGTNPIVFDCRDDDFPALGSKM
ncbi:uncharacterized protein BXIN_3087 [Babesia sp. Xinjiang]|uniref:uncharacterized protein n=1 Tax=Babesia sp. Xinjiang TaxID=462227 RepID=UPI000A21B5C0|nr:uncharacterized protein BXIN_3087 [Babesia sp. Xinjiang]ORM39554.1 hypothetical protein BXIN_3087 [Babesia sp. Xinjiang]